MGKEDLKFRNEVRAGDSAVVNNKLYVFGGNNYLLREVYEFDPVSDSWTVKKGGFTQLNPSSAVYNGKILVTGSVFIVRMYDPNTETFSRLSVPKTDYLMAHSSAIVDDTLY